MLVFSGKPFHPRSRHMSIKTSLTRRQALMLSGSAAAGLAAGGLPRWAHGAPSSRVTAADPATDRGAQRRARHALAAEDAASIWAGAGGAVTGNLVELPRTGGARPQRRYRSVPCREPSRRGDDAALARAAGALARRRRSSQYDQAGRGLVTGDHDQAAGGDDLVPSPPAREHGPASLLRACRHDDRQRRRRPRPRPARHLRRRRSSHRVAGQAVRTRRRARLPAEHDGHHARLPRRHAAGQWRHRLRSRMCPSAWCACAC